MINKYFLIALITLVHYSAISQTINFSQELPYLPNPQISAIFDGAYDGSIGFADIDGDGDEDLLITGERTGALEGAAKLYENDGLGNFTLIEGTTFEAVSRSSLDFADIDGDGDQDVLIAGYNGNSDRVSNLYRNDGDGNFMLVSGTPFVGVSLGSVNFADVDGDDDQDVLITGNTFSLSVSNLYRNDGAGNFSLVSGTPFRKAGYSSAAFSDVDGDNDLDVLIAGDNGQNYSELYLNDGLGVFTKLNNTPFVGISDSSVAFADVDGDNDNDVLLSGSINSSQGLAALYKNDGLGNFEPPNFNFLNESGGYVIFSDVDNDGDQDFLLTAVGRLYINDGTGDFSPMTDTPFYNTIPGSSAVADVNGDGFSDIVTAGNPYCGYRSAVLYLNNTTGNFNEITGSPFKGVINGDVKFADIDNDGDLDLLYTGQSSQTDICEVVTKLFTNDGLGIFEEIVDTPFIGSFYSAVEFEDVDNDADLDVLIVGLNPSFQNSAELYLNDGAGNFSLQSSEPFTGGSYPSIVFSDIDNDLDLDVTIITDQIKVYNNNGNGHFTYNSNILFQGFYEGAVIEYLDFDNDGDQDALLAGNNISDQKITKLFRNGGSGNFSEVSNTPFLGVGKKSTITLFDFENDGDEDILIIGQNNDIEASSNLYLSDGSGNYNISPVNPFEAFNYNIVALTDIDEDGDDDLLISGTHNNNVPQSILYQNNGNGAFETVQNLPFDNVNLGGLSVGDIDSDGYPEVFLTGVLDEEIKVAKLYRNNTETLGVANTEISSNKILIYPNPANDYVTIKFSTSKNHSVIIYSIDGKPIFEKKEIGSNEFNFKFSAPTGIYIIQINSETGRESFKLIKN